MTFARRHVGVVDSGNSCRGHRMDVEIALECVHEACVFRQVREYSQFDLAVIGDEKRMVIFGDERLPDDPTFLAANRDVLQVRLFL